MVRNIFIINKKYLVNYKNKLYNRNVIFKLMDNFKKYLPSKKFIVVIMIIFVIIILFFAIKKIIPLIKFKKGGPNGEQITMTVGDLIQKDGNSNGIADWEEYLWGLDPNKNGPENKEFILAKKKSLANNGIISNVDDSKSITQNELLSRQFFATIMSLQQSGNLDADAIENIASTIGQEAKAVPLSDIYTKEMLNIKADSDESNINYLKTLSDLVEKYEDRDIGEEMTIFSQGIVNSDPQALYVATTIADAYKEFAEDLIKMPVPSYASIAHLSLANNYQKVGVSIEGFTQVLSDPIIGMRSLLNYKKYTDAIASDFDKLSNILQ